MRFLFQSLLAPKLALGALQLVAVVTASMKIGQVGERILSDLPLTHLDWLFLVLSFLLLFLILSASWRRTEIAPEVRS